MTTISYDLDAKTTQKAGLKVSRVWRTLERAAEEWNNKVFVPHDVPCRFESRPGAGNRADVLVAFSRQEVVTQLGGPGSRGAHTGKRGFSTIYFSYDVVWKAMGDWRFWREPLLPGMLHELGHALTVEHVENPDFLMWERWPGAAKRIDKWEAMNYAAQIKAAMRKKS